MIEMQKETQNDFRFLGILLIQSAWFALVIYLYETVEWSQPSSLYESIAVGFVFVTGTLITIHGVFVQSLERRSFIEEVEQYRRRMERERRLAETKFLTNNEEFRQKMEQLYSKYAYNGSEENRP
jgi:hypothetical protein